jgi:hypothetical protein
VRHRCIVPQPLPIPLPFPAIFQHSCHRDGHTSEGQAARPNAANGVCLPHMLQHITSGHGYCTMWI